MTFSQAAIWILQLANCQLKSKEDGLHLWKALSEDTSLPNLMKLNDWLQEEAQMHQRLINSSSLSGNIGFSNSISTNWSSANITLLIAQGSSFNESDDSAKLNSKSPVDNDSYRSWNYEKLRQCR